MKTVDIVPPKNLSSKFTFSGVGPKGETVSSDIPEALLEFTPSGNFNADHVGMRILTVGHFVDAYGIKQYFIMFNAIGEEGDCLNRQGRIWSSALISHDKNEVISQFEQACRTGQLLALFPCLHRVSNPAMHSTENFLEECTESEFQRMKYLTAQLKKSESVTLSTSQDFHSIYQSSERLILNSFRFFDLVGCSFNGIRDNVFDLCIIAGRRDSFSSYSSSQNPWEQSLQLWAKLRQIPLVWITAVSLIMICLILSLSVSK